MPTSQNRDMGHPVLSAQHNFQHNQTDLKLQLHGELVGGFVGGGFGFGGEVEDEALED